MSGLGLRGAVVVIWIGGVALLCGGCAAGSGTTSAAAGAGSGTTAAAAGSGTTSAAAGPRSGTTSAAAGAHAAPGASARLAYSTVPGTDVQAQPPPGSCHARGVGRFSRPDPRCTPGALNPAVTQATIDQTICVTGWSARVRPPEDVSEPEKLASMAAYGMPGPARAYEYDHLVALSLGGAVNDPRNLWPEPGASPNPKDAVEYRLHREVCDGSVSLATAQRAIAADWTALAGRG